MALVVTSTRAPMLMGGSTSSGRFNVVWEDRQIDGLYLFRDEPLDFRPIFFRSAWSALVLSIGRLGGWDCVLPGASVGGAGENRTHE
jgi:hypothetical protein